MLHGSPMSYDLILRGGRVVDPSQKLDAVTDVAFADGKVARIGAGLRPDAKTDVHDVSGRIVTPGLIDLHTHVYWGGTSLGVDAEDFCRRSGVTTAVDTGSAGPGNFAGFRKHVIERSAVRILAYLHVSFAGIYAFSPRVMVGESEEIRLMAPIDAVEVANANRDIIVGIKVRVGARASGRSGTVPLDIALEVADEVGVPVMAHIDEPPPSYVIAASTVNAAFALKRPELGSLKPGSVGDATILSISDGRFDYVDVVGEPLTGDRKIASQAVVMAGRWWHPKPSQPVKTA